MYVKKFEGDSLDETLKLVKRELGPDAIILKTITNKGIKGAFKKSRIEITAAISEESYAKKAKVDRVMDHEQLDKFYSAPSTSINQMINQYNEPGKSKAVGQGYGNMGLNRSVSMAEKPAPQKQRRGASLDDFLASEEPRKEEFNNRSFQPQMPQTEALAYEEEEDDDSYYESYSAPQNVRGVNVDALDLKQQIKGQQNKIDILEKKLFELTQNITMANHHRNEDDLPSLKVFHQNLKTLDLSETVIQSLIRKASFELSRDDLEDIEVLYEFALRELNSMIHTALPMFSAVGEDQGPFITVLLNEGASGQTSMAYKIATLRSETSIVQFSTEKEIPANYDMVKSLYNLDVSKANSASELMNFIRKAIEKKRSVIVDIKFNRRDLDESKKIIDGLRRSFNNVEFLVTLSAINSEIYNRKILAKYKDFSDGVIISNVDQCMSFGALLNVHLSCDKLPLKFFGTGPVIPEDIEAASSERILASMFEL